MPEYRRCISPGCDGGQLHDAGDAAPIMTCIACGHKMCFTHRVVWHTGLTCADFDTSKETKTQTRERVSREEVEVRKTVRPCRGCNVDSEKAGGCENMCCDCPRQWNSIHDTDMIHRHKMLDRILLVSSNIVVLEGRLASLTLLIDHQAIT